MALWLVGIMASRLFGSLYLPADSPLAGLLESAALAWPLLLLPMHGSFLQALRTLGAHRRLLLLVLLYLGSLLLSVSYARYTGSSLQYIALVAVLLVIAYAFGEVLDSAGWTLSLSAYALIGGGLLVLHLLAVGYVGSQGRLRGSMNPNAVGMIAFSILVSALAIERRSWRFVTVSSAATALLLTNSRTSIGAALVALCVYYLTQQRRPSFSRVGAAIVVLATLALVLWFGRGSAVSLAGEILQVGDGYRDPVQSAATRMDAWSEAWEIFESSPFVGVGFRQHQLYMRGFSSAHNGYLTVLAETGLVGFGAMFLLVSAGVVGLWRNRDVPDTALALALVTGYLGIAIFERYMVNLGNPASILFALAIVRGVLLGPRRRRRNQGSSGRIPITGAIGKGPADNGL